MITKKKNQSKRRTKVKDLPQQTKELRKEELKDVQGGHTLSGSTVPVVGPSGTNVVGGLLDVNTEKNSGGIVIVPAPKQ